MKYLHKSAIGIFYRQYIKLKNSEIIKKNINIWMHEKKIDEKNMFNLIYV